MMTDEQLDKWVAEHDEKYKRVTDFHSVYGDYRSYVVWENGDSFAYYCEKNKVNSWNTDFKKLINNKLVQAGTMDFRDREVKVYYFDEVE